ncbi:MAG: SEC-C domain-containing protein [Gammaproteobacteria bacterium]|jgi:hypothetical protein
MSDNTASEPATQTNNNSNNDCPCGSGFSYSDCCGAPGRNALNAPSLAFLSPDGIEGEESLTTALKSSIDNASLNPDLFPARINYFERKAWFVKMSPQWYGESVFLDPGRMKGTCVIGADLDWLQQTAERIAWQPTSYIFHTAFCGSTLMSQALSAVYDSLPVREPEVLGNLLVYLRSNAEPTDEHPGRIQQVLNLLSRRYVPEQPVVVKANDYANPFMPVLLDHQKAVPVLFMYTPFAEFLAGCLKADNRRQWIKQRFQAVQQFTSQVLSGEEGLQLEDDEFGKMAAVYWSYNVALFLQVQRAAPEQIRSLDFNTMLADPLAAVQCTATLFGLNARVDVNAQDEVDRLFGVYSKNSQFKYSPQQRNKDIVRILEANEQQLSAGEALAKKLLGNDYPEQGLPATIVDQSM